VESAIATAAPSADTEFLDPAGVPRWDAVSFDVACSRCGYNLRMLAEPRCPECGLTFEWREVLNSLAAQGPFLFEHNWRRRPLRSWLTTVGRGFFPRSFWQQVSIHERVRAGPLWVMLLLSAAVHVVVFLTIPFLIHVLLSLALGIPVNQSAPNGAWAAAVPTWAEPMYGVTYGLSVGRLASGALVLHCVCALLFHLFVPACLLILFQTLARHRLRQVQMLRAVAYAATPASILAASLTVLILIGKTIPGIHLLGSAVLDLLPSLRFVPLHNTILLLTVCVGIGTLYGSVAIRDYVRLPQPKQIAFVSLFLPALAILVLVFAYRGWR
jgi:hypothetical protein